MSYYDKLRSMIGKTVICEGQVPDYSWTGRLLEVYYHAGGEGMIALEVQTDYNPTPTLINPAHCLAISVARTTTAATTGGDGDEQQ